MKRITLVLIAMVGFVFVANAQQARASVPGDGNTVLVSVTSDSQTSSDLMFYNNSTKTVTVRVSVYNGRNEVGSDSFTISGADAQGSHTESTATLRKINACRSCSSGCETTRISIEVTRVH